MSTDESSLPRDGFEVIRRIDQVNAKVDLLARDVSHLTTESKASIELVSEKLGSAIERLADQQEDHLRLIEQRMDMSSREQQQSITLLTATVQKHEQQTSAVQTELQMVSTEQVRMDAATKQNATDIADINNRISTYTRLGLGAVLSLATSGILYAITH